MWHQRDLLIGPLAAELWPNEGTSRSEMQRIKVNQCDWPWPRPRQDVKILIWDVDQLTSIDGVLYQSLLLKPSVGQYGLAKWADWLKELEIGSKKVYFPYCLMFFKYNTPQIVYKVAICPRGKLPYIQITSILLPYSQSPNYLVGTFLSWRRSTLYPDHLYNATLYLVTLQTICGVLKLKK